MRYRLDELAKVAADLGFEARRVDPDRLDVVVADSVLAFCNLEADDTLIGFKGTPWHGHGNLYFETGRGTRDTFDELDVLVGLSVGELVVVSQFVNGVLQDRWISHRNEPIKLRHIQPGEELRAYRLPLTRPPEADAER
jgi:hypothetical protein